MQAYSILQRITSCIGQVDDTGSIAENVVRSQKYNMWNTTLIFLPLIFLAVFLHRLEKPNKATTS